MAWNGYFTLDGSEIINGPRTEAYAAADGKTWFRPQFKNDDLAPMLGQATYQTPLLDAAPWVDPDEPVSEDFYGFYPLDVAGVENSTRGSTVVESTLDGGNPGRLRHGTKAVVFNGVLMGASEAAVEYGMRWLKRALLGAVCSDDLSTDQSQGADLSYLASEPILSSGVTEAGDELILDGGGAAEGDFLPDVPDPDPLLASAEAELTPLVRLLRRFVVNNGPTVTSKRTMSCGGAIWTATFTGVAGTPYEFGAEKPLIQGFMDPAVADPWVPGVTPGYFDAVGTAWDEVTCGVDTWEPIFDPACPALIVPPAPPSVPLGCYTPVTTWSRRKIAIPAENVPLWGEVVPVVTVFAPTEARNIRLRFYADPTGTNDPNENPCSFTGDVVMSYIPAGGTMVFDAALEQVFVITALGHRRRADSLVFRTDGHPFEWPSLSCGYGHIVTLDLPAGQAEPVVDLSLIPRVI